MHTLFPINTFLDFDISTSLEASDKEDNVLVQDLAKLPASIFHNFNVQLIWDTISNCNIGWTATYTSRGAVDLWDRKSYQLTSCSMGTKLQDRSMSLA